MKKNQGFTLIELLVSMSLLSMTILLATSAFGLFGQRWDGRLGKFDSIMRDSQNMLLVQDVLDSLVPYIVFDKAGAPIIYFEGNRNGFISVSSKSIYSYGDFAVVRFSIRQNIDLTFDVIYEESPMNRELLISVEQNLNFSDPLVLFNDVTDPMFRYYGWPTISERGDAVETTAIPAYWSENYDAAYAIFAPIKAAINFTSASGQFRIVSTLTTQKNGLLSRYKARSPYDG